jgi:hypothetical protein
MFGSLDEEILASSSSVLKRTFSNNAAKPRKMFFLGYRAGMQPRRKGVLQNKKRRVPTTLPVPPPPTCSLIVMERGKGNNFFPCFEKFHNFLMNGKQKYYEFVWLFFAVMRQKKAESWNFIRMKCWRLGELVVMKL